MPLRIDRRVIEIIANDNRSRIAGRNKFKLINGLNDRALNVLYRTFVLHDKDRRGKYLEYQLANFFM